MPITQHLRPKRHFLIGRRRAALGIGAIAWTLAVVFLAVHLAVGPPAQRITIRWVSAVSDLARARLERQAGLVSGEQTEQRTWSYLIRERSRENIEALVSNPFVEETGHVDRVNFRVQLDRPDLPASIRSMLEADDLPLISCLLTLAGLIAIGYGRQEIPVARLRLRVRRGAMRAVHSFARDARNEATGPLPGEVLRGILLGGLFLVPLLIYGPYEEEVVQATIFPNQVFYKALFHGKWLLWFNDLGFGTPFPTGDPLMFHPVFGPLAAIASLRATLTVVWLVHIVVMVVYMLRLAAASGIGPRLRMILLGCYLGSAASMTYFYDTDWVQMAIAWSLYPVLAFYLRRAVLGDAVRRFWLTALRLAVLFGFWIINAHPGYIVPLVLVLAIYTVVAAPPSWRLYKCLCLGGVLCVMIAAARLYVLVHEARLFPPTLSVDRPGSSLAEYASSTLTLSPLHDRMPFIGLGIGLAAMVSIIRVPALRDRHLRGCTAAFLAAIALNVLPPSLSPPAIGTWLFRDPMIFFGLLAGGSQLQRGFNSPRLRSGVATLVLISVQIVQQGAVVTWPSLAAFFEHRNLLQFYRHQGKAVGLGRVLLDQASVFGPRVYLSPDVDAAMRGELSAEGIHFSSDLALLGLNPINGWFKNVSMDAFYPSDSLMESFIKGDRTVLGNKSLLDVLAIDIVVSKDREGPILESLRTVHRAPVSAGALGGDLLIRGNADAWPQAVLLQADALDVTLPIHPGCAHRAALCRDYEGLAKRRLRDTVELTRMNGRYDVRFVPSDRTRVLFVSATYRPEWQATSAAGALRVNPVAGAFLGVRVPAGISELTLAYVPRLQIALTWFSSLVFLVTLMITCVLSRRRIPAGGIPIEV